MPTVTDRYADELARLLEVGPREAPGVEGRGRRQARPAPAEVEQPQPGGLPRRQGPRDAREGPAPVVLTLARRRRETRASEAVMFLLLFLSAVQ